METAKIKIGKVDSEPAGSFSAAFVLPITRDGRVLLTKEKRGQIIRYGMLGGVARSDETDFQCMSREAKEETGGALSLITLARIADGRGILDRSKVHYENSKSFAVKHDLVVASDLDIDSRFEPARWRRCAQVARPSPRRSVRRKQRRRPCNLELNLFRLQTCVIGSGEAAKCTTTLRSFALVS